MFNQFESTEIGQLLKQPRELKW